MTFPDGEDRIPTQAELDAEDMAEIERKSRDADSRDRYPARSVDPGEPPNALARDARVAWGLAALACLIWVGYATVHLSDITDLLADRLVPGLREAPGVDPESQAQSLAGFWPVAFLIGIPVYTAVTWPMLVGIARWHSRNLRSVYLASLVILLLFVPVAADLLFNYPQIPDWVNAMAWVQFGLLLVSMLMTLRRSVGQWLPPSMRMRAVRPGRDG